MVETPERALVVIPHPDDAEGSCGGTIARWTGLGTAVFFVLCTDGGKGSNDPEMTPEQLAIIREKEQLEAASTLGVQEVVLLRHPDGELEDTNEFRGEIVAAIRRFRPDVLLCPDPYRQKSHSHRDHRVTGQVAADAAFPYARDPLHFRDLLKNQGLEPHKTGMILFWSPDVADTIIDISDTVEVKARALLCHRSQMSRRTYEEVVESMRGRAGEVAEDSGFQYGEGFRKIEFRR